ncbi:Aminopeptidase N, partial [Gryllus bimaculatus]
MLFNSSISTAQSQQSVASVVAHELAHQWFGNLVTMDWWSDLWLNEGFATYVSYIGVNHVEPTWHMLDKIVTEQMHPVLETDALNSSHPVSVEVQNPSQISEAFDEVSYNKGACLIRMLNHSLTEEVFRSGLTNYLIKWTWSNANQDDLWASLTEAAGNVSGLLPAGASVKAVMETWTLQKGYPVVMVRRDYSAGSLHLSQRQFKLEGTDGAGARDDRALSWYVPVSYATGEDVKWLQDTRPRAWLTPEHSDGLNISAVTAPGSNTWLLLNVQQTGYYRVNYDSANWRLLSDLLQTGPLETVPAASRAQLLSDALNLARAGLLNYDTALNLTSYLSRETDAVPWKAFVRAYSFLDDMLRDSREYTHLQVGVGRLETTVAVDRPLATGRLREKSSD